MSSSAKATARSSVRVPALRPDEEQRRYVFEQLSRALGDDWIERNHRLVEDYWQAVVTLGYALPDERPADDQEAAA
jgi:hypothetical protein